MKLILKKSSNFNLIKSFILILISFSNWGFSQKKMMIHPSVELTASPLFHLFEKNSSLIFNQNQNYEFGGFFVNKFLLKKNSLDLRIGCNWNNKSYNITNIGNSVIKSTFTAFTYINVPVLLSFSFDKYRIVKPFISGGYSFGFLKKEFRETTFQSGETSTGFGNDVINYKKPSYFVVSIGANIQCYRQLSICLEPFYKQCIRQEGPSQDNRVIKSLGLRVGLVFKLPDFEWK